jgi:tetratricopeptide (TPR) repeat protein
VCRSDDACAGGLYALLVDAIRPDVDVVPAQHLWDPTVLRQLEGLADENPAADPPAFEQRARVAAFELRRLVVEQRVRRVLLASSEPLRELGPTLLRRHSATVPFLAVGSGVPTLASRVALGRLERMRAARGGRFRSGRAQHAWSHAYELVGEQALAGDLDVAERAFRVAVRLAPKRAAALTNLGVVLERRARPYEAATQYQRALQLDPFRPTPWVNLARLTAERRGSAAGLEVLELARRAGIEDPRLTQLERALRASASQR